jgi:broad-specificity NMP kinase
MKIGVSLIVRSGGKILLVQTNDKYSFPSIKLEKNLAFEQIKKIFSSDVVISIFKSRSVFNGIKPSYILVLADSTMVPNSLMPKSKIMYKWLKMSKSIVSQLDQADLKAYIAFVKYLESPKVILVSGTPGTGKTTFAQKLSLLIRGTYIDVNYLIKKHKLSSGYDRLRATNEVPISKLIPILVKTVKNAKKHVIIDSHLSHYFPSNRADLCVITVCNDLKRLKIRLDMRGYNSLKIQENLEAEIFQTCKIDALERGHNVLIIDSSKKYSISKFLNRYNSILYPL